MTGLHRDADFTVGLETSNTGAMPSARIDHHERSFLWIDDRALGRTNPNKSVVHRLLEFAPVDDKVAFELQDVRSGFCSMLGIALTPLTHHVQEQQVALPRINPIAPRIERR